jgi:hypothetical protein
MRAVRHVVLMLMVVALVGGCGSASGDAGPPTPAPSDNGIAALPVSDIFTKAAAALRLASSVHVKGQLNDGTETIGLDLTVNHMRDGLGTVVFNGQHVQVTKLGTDLYVKADAGFWTQTFPGDQGHTIATLMAGKYLRVATTNPTLGPLATSFSLVDELDLGGAATKGPIKTINGVPAISLVEATGTFWVATRGEPFPLRADQGNGQAVLDFTDYNKPVVIATPPADQVIDVSKLTP